MDEKAQEYARKLIMQKKSAGNLTRKRLMKDGDSFNNQGKPNFKTKGSSINSVSHNRGRV